MAGWPRFGAGVLGVGCCGVVLGLFLRLCRRSRRRLLGRGLGRRLPGLGLGSCLAASPRVAGGVVVVVVVRQVTAKRFIVEIVAQGFGHVGQ